MNAMPFTVHAQKRLAQRAVKREVVDLLLRFGTSTRSHGAERYFIDKAARKRLCREVSLETFREYERFLNAYAVVSDSGVVITAGHRTRRFRR